jgi:hypothetical protein
LEVTFQAVVTSRSLASSTWNRIGTLQISEADLALQLSRCFVFLRPFLGTQDRCSFDVSDVVLRIPKITAMWYDRVSLGVDCDIRLGLKSFGCI